MSRYCSIFPLIFLLLCVVAGAAEPGLGKVRTIPQGWLGWNANLAGSVGWQRESFAQVVTSLKPGTLRYPGGSVGNYWDWQRGGVIQGVAADIDFIRALGRRPTANPNTVASFSTIIKHTSAEPVWMLNMETRSLEDQLAMLRAAREAGLSVRLVELGNEFYFNLPGVRRRFPTATDYCREAGQWAKAIRAEFPEARCAALAVGAGIADEGRERIRTWDAGLREHLRGVQALTVHCYVHSPLNERAVAIAMANNWPIPTDINEREQSQNWQRALIASRRAPGAAEKVVTNARKSVQRVLSEGLSGLPAGLPVWITEYNLFDQNQFGVGGTWAHALATAAMTLDFLVDSRIELVQCHNLIGGKSFAAIDPGRGQDAPSRLTPLGTAIQALAEALEGMTEAAPVNTGRALIAVQLRGATGLRLVVINPTDGPISMDGMQNFIPDQGRGQVWRAEALATEPPTGVQNNAASALPRSLAVYE